MDGRKGIKGHNSANMAEGGRAGRGRAGRGREVGQREGRRKEDVINCCLLLTKSATIQGSQHFLAMIAVLYKTTHCGTVIKVWNTRCEKSSAHAPCFQCRSGTCVPLFLTYTIPILVCWFLISRSCGYFPIQQLKERNYYVNLKLVSTASQLLQAPGVIYQCMLHHVTLLVISTLTLT